MSSLTEILVLNQELGLERLDEFQRSALSEDANLRRLVRGGDLSALALAKARAQHGGLPFVQLSDYAIDPEAVALIPPGLCRRYTILPVGVRDDGAVFVATSEPDDIFALDDARAAVGRRIVPLVADPADITQAINRFLRADSELSDLSSTLEEEHREPSALAAEDMPEDDEAPIVRFVNLLIAQAIQDRASDIHIEPVEDALRLRCRIDGVLKEMPSAPKSIQAGVISRIKIMADMDIAERRKPQDGRMSVSDRTGSRVDLRVASLPTVWGEKIVLRILDGNASSRSMRDLAMLDDNFEKYRTAYQQPFGMILVTGPTGSGKSTSLYTTLHAVSRTEVNVVTVEDPVESRIPGVNQVQVNPRAGLTFASALRSILRCDPDVVLIGEIRDRETAQIAIESSLTGHLVLSTLHTNDAPSAITRLTEMEIEPFLIGSALTCVVAQRLARRLCERCKQPVEFAREDLARIHFEVSAHEPPPVLYGPVGCPQCSNTGFRGRIAVHEVMPVTEEIERLAVARASSAEIGRVARDQGMTTLRQDGWAKVRLGLTSVQEVLRVVAE